MQIALNARNKFVIVNGSYTKPASSESPLYAQWERVNDMIITWILNCVADDISDGLNYVTTASEVWNELSERFSSVNGHRIFQILKDTHSLDQGNKSVEVYFHKLKSLWDEYSVLEPAVTSVCGAHKFLLERDQKRKLLQFLMGLHDSHANVRSQILLMNPLPTVSHAFAYVKQDERARQGYSVAEISPFANSANVTQDFSSSTGGFKKPVFIKSQSSQSVHISGKASVKCSYCNFNGHIREQCYKLVGYPPNWKKKDKTSSVTQFRNFPKANLASVDQNVSSSTPMSSNTQIDQLQK
ncbi:uncharacterized protein LOC141679549 [Apium graveolens]|uniref:uncharacterized protein LOC141679549 n=1 Tax=Apium graveolens TaxID=4045 RepID=UPI003D7908B7